MIKILLTTSLLCLFSTSYSFGGAITYPEYNCSPVVVKSHGSKVTFTPTLYAETAPGKMSFPAALQIKMQSRVETITAIAMGTLQGSNLQPRTFIGKGLDERFFLIIDVTVPYEGGKPVRPNAVLERQYSVSSRYRIDWYRDFKTELICSGIEQEESVGAHNK